MTPDDHEVAPGPDCYDVLDVDPSASTEEIRVAWRAAIADLTPADRRFRLYNRAAEVLLDPERRAAHDAELAVESAPPPSDDATAAPVDDAPAAPAGRVVPTWLLLGVAVLTVLAVGATAWLWRQPSDASVADAAGSARSAAERAAVPILAYDYETLEQDQQAAHEVMTSDYREDYDELFAVIEENAPRTEAKIGVDVVSSAVVRAGEERAEILLFLDRPTTNKQSEDPVVYKDQATLTMARVDGRWLVDDVVSSPAQPQ